MNTERIFNIIITDLTTNLLILENELERTINSDTDTNSKLMDIKRLLREISLTEFSMTKFRSMVTNNNNNNQNPQENGQV
jgi:hypothetical protein